MAEHGWIYVLTIDGQANLPCASFTQAVHFADVLRHDGFEVQVVRTRPDPAMLPQPNPMTENPIAE